MGRVEINGFPEIRDRLIRSALIKQNDAEIVIGDARVRPKGERHAKEADRDAVLPISSQSGAEEIVSKEVVGMFQLQAFEEVGFVAACIAQSLRQTNQQLHRHYLDFGGAGEFAQLRPIQE